MVAVGGMGVVGRERKERGAGRHGGGAWDVVDVVRVQGCG